MESALAFAADAGMPTVAVAARGRRLRRMPSPGWPLLRWGCGAKPYELAMTLLRELAAGPSVLVLEDVHWADEATLDVIRLVGRRVAEYPVLLVLSYRDDELDRSHPLRIVLGDLPGSGG